MTEPQGATKTLLFMEQVFSCTGNARLSLLPDPTAFAASYNP